MKTVCEIRTAALSPAECDAIVAKAATYPAREATVGVDQPNRVEQALRESTIRWIPPAGEPRLVQRIMGLVTAANRMNFGFDIAGLFDIQFTEYHGSRQDKYDWHHDVRLTGPMAYDRKLSVVIQLSDPADYDGGAFEFSTIAHPGAAFAPRGSVLIFPSFLQHRVRPVTRGIRNSLVTWVEGPRWR